MFSVLILAATLTGQSAIGEPPANASPELRALYKQANASARASAPAPAPVAPSKPVTSSVASPVRKQTMLNSLPQPDRFVVNPLDPDPAPAQPVAAAKKRPDPAHEAKIDADTQAFLHGKAGAPPSGSSLSKAQLRRNYNAKFEAEEAAKAAAAARAAAVYNYFNTPNYMNVTRRSDGSFSTYTTTPGGQAVFKDYTPVIRTPKFGVGVGPSYLDWDVYTSQSQTYTRP